MKRPLVVLVVEVYAGLIALMNFVSLAELVRAYPRWIELGQPVSQLLGAAVFLFGQAAFAAAVLWGIEAKNPGIRMPAILFLWVSFFLYPVQNMLRGSVLPPPMPIAPQEVSVAAVFEIVRTVLLIGTAIWLRSSARFKGWVGVSMGTQPDAKAP